MKIPAALFAAILLTTPAFAQGDQGKPAAPAGDAAQEPAQAPPGTTPDKPAEEPEPDEAPAGTEPVKPASDAPQG